MTTGIDAAVEVSVSALEFCEEAWSADERGEEPDLSRLPDPVLSAVALYPDPDLPRRAWRAIRAEASRRRLGDPLDRWLPWAVLGAICGSGAAVGLTLFVS